MPGEGFDEETMKMYDKLPNSMVAMGVYTKLETLQHKQEMVKRLLRSLATEGTEAYHEAINDEDETYTGVYWIVPFNFGDGKSLEETLNFKYGIENHDTASTPMQIGYHGELKRLWFASDGKWQGYFDVESVEGNDVYIHKWHELEEKDKIPRKAFQGYTYNVLVWEEVSE